MQYVLNSFDILNLKELVNSVKSRIRRKGPTVTKTNVRQVSSVYSTVG